MLSAVPILPTQLVNKCPRRHRAHCRSPDYQRTVRPRSHPLSLSVLPYIYLHCLDTRGMGSNIAKMNEGGAGLQLIGCFQMTPRCCFLFFSRPFSIPSRVSSMPLRMATLARASYNSAARWRRRQNRCSTAAGVLSTLMSTSARELEELDTPHRGNHF